MKIDLYDLMDCYEGEPVDIKVQTGASVRNVKKRTTKKIMKARKNWFHKKVVITALLILCLGTTAFAVATVSNIETFIHNSLGEQFEAVDCPGLNVVATVNSGTEIGQTIDNGEVILVTDHQMCWDLIQNQSVEITIEIKTKDKRTVDNPGYGIYVGYVLCDDNNVAIDEQKVCFMQTSNTATCEFFVPQDGHYYFYILHVASDPFTLDTFQVKPQSDT